MATAQQVTDWIQRIPLDRKSPQPLHHQLSQGILCLVSEGKLLPGERMPKVADLSSLCGVSKGTAMQAVDELRRRQRLIVKRRSGIHVAEAQARAVEVFFCAVSQQQGVLGDFLEQVLNGLKAGYEDPTRRFMVTLVNGHELTAQGLRAAAEARGVDGLVFYRPSAAIASAAAGVARLIPAVSLVRALPESPAACAAISIAPALSRLLQGHLANSIRSFAYVGQLGMLKKEADGPYAPYNGFYQAALETLAEADLELTVCLTPDHPQPPPTPEREDQLVRRAASLPAGSVVLAQTGTLAEKLSRLDKGFRIITYTEYRATLEACRGKATVLYGGLELLGQAAARALKGAGGNPAGLQPGVIWVEPQVVE